MNLDRSHAYRFLAAALFILLALDARPDVTFRTTRVRVANHPLTVEVAASDPQRTQGLDQSE